MLDNEEEMKMGGKFDSRFCLAGLLTGLTILSGCLAESDCHKIAVKFADGDTAAYDDTDHVYEGELFLAGYTNYRNLLSSADVRLELEYASGMDFVAEHRPVGNLTRTYIDGVDPIGRAGFTGRYEYDQQGRLDKTTVRIIEGTNYGDLQEEIIWSDHDSDGRPIRGFASLKTGMPTADTAFCDGIEYTQSYDDDSLTVDRRRLGGTFVGPSDLDSFSDGCVSNKFTRMRYHRETRALTNVSIWKDQRDAAGEPDFERNRSVTDIGLVCL